MALGCILVGTACGHRAHRVPADAVVVPGTSVEIELDGEWEEADWDHVAMREVFTAHGTEARPFSEIRMLHDNDTLYVTLYAADENVLSSEAFDLSIGTVSTHVNPQGKLAPPIAGVKTGADLDGTLDLEIDSDEEWVIELAIPISAVGISMDNAVPVHAARCDVPRAGGRSCGAWDGTIVLGGS